MAEHDTHVTKSFKTYGLVNKCFMIKVIIWAILKSKEKKRLWPKRCFRQFFVLDFKVWPWPLTKPYCTWALNTVSSWWKFVSSYFKFLQVMEDFWTKQAYCLAWPWPLVHRVILYVLSCVVLFHNYQKMPFLENIVLTQYGLNYLVKNIIYIIWK